jgi:CubicO group peptidase (beta-lactamase class C family)
MGVLMHRMSCLAALFLCSCAAQTAGKPQAGGGVPQAAGPCRSELAGAASTEAIRRANEAAIGILTDRMQKRLIAGAQIAVVKNNEIVMLQSCGLADLEFGNPVQRDTRFHIASATKPFTGVAIMQLVEAGKLELDAPASRYLDDLPAAWRTVTVRQLLTHVSGLPEIVNTGTNTASSRSAGGTIDPSSEAAAWAKVITLPMQFAPGERYIYNQTNYLLLGRIIDKLSGKPFVDFIKERQFDVVGMPQAIFTDSYEVVPKRARVYSYAETVNGQMRQGTVPKNFVGEISPFLRTASSLHTTADEIARWIVALNKGQLLSAGARKEMWTAGKMPDGKPTAWALGWPAYPRAEHPAVAGIGGAMAAFYVYPEDDVAVVILTNVIGGQPEQFIEQVAQLYGEDAPARQ